VSEPARTVTGAHRGEKALVTPFLTEHANASTQRNMPADEPARTVCGEVKGGHFAMVAGTLIGAGGPAYSGKPKPVP
jgi:DNA (cytosine-5)-methyltransferase 1